MRMQFIATIALLAVAGSAAAETRSLSGFTGVSASDRICVEVTLGEAYRVDVSGSDASKVATRIEDDRLVIRRTHRPFWGGTPSMDALVRVTMPAIDGLSASRGAELSATGLDGGDLSLAAAMGGELRVTGACGALSVSVAMGGMVRAEGLQCRDANVAASMGGDARVFASNSIDVSATMGGSVSAAGGGEAQDIALSMGGSFDRD